MKIGIALILVLLVSGCATSRYEASNFKSYKHCKEYGSKASHRMQFLPEFKQAPTVKAMVTNRKTAECYVASGNTEGNAIERTSSAVNDALQQCYAVTKDYSDCGVVAVNKWDLGMNYKLNCESEFNGRYKDVSTNKAIALAVSTNSKKEKNRCFVSSQETNFDTPDDAIKDALSQCMTSHLWGCVVYAVNDQNIDYEDFHLTRYSTNDDLVWKYGNHYYYVTQSGNRSPYGEFYQGRNERKYRKERSARTAAINANNKAYAREKAGDRAHQRRLKEIANTNYFPNRPYISKGKSTGSSKNKSKSTSSSGSKKQNKIYCYMSGAGPGNISSLYFSSVFSSTNEKWRKHGDKWGKRFASSIGGKRAGSHCLPTRSRATADRERNYKNAESSVRKYGVKTSWSP